MAESKKLRIWLGTALLISAASGGILSAQDNGTAERDYHITVGDTVRIDVWKHPEMAGSVRVRPDGNINLPLIGDVKASGLSATGLAGLIRDKLKDRVADPQVTVTISELGKRLYGPPPAPNIDPEIRQKCCVA